MAVAFSVTFMAGLENDYWLVVRINHQSIMKFSCETLSERAAFRNTKVFKGPQLSTLEILDLQTHFKPTETFQYTHFLSCHPFKSKKGFIKGEVLRLL